MRSIKHGNTLAVREHLVEGKPISRIEALVLFGVQNLTQVISTLRTEGFIIKSKRQRDMLWYLQGGRCALCNCTIPKTRFHADHIVAYIKGGKTVIENGQALCPGCNLRKGASC